jgi:hypothetical protein
VVAAKSTDAEFIRVYEEHGPSKAAKILGVHDSNVRQRRRRLEAKLNIRINGPEHHNAIHLEEHPDGIVFDVTDGVVLVGGDGHYWPGDNPLAHRALIEFAKEFKPKALVIQGDVFDGARISRHPPIGWAKMPTVQDEIEVCQDRMNELALAVPRGCRKVWSLGNHDGRFEASIAAKLPDFAKVHGASLKDHFPVWEPCWGCFINDNPSGVVIKHFFKGGLHANVNNALWGGRTMVTGHLHNAKVYPLSDYNGTRYGVETGCLADIQGRVRGRQFNYTQSNPLNWMSGFAFLTFKGGRLLYPELVTAFDRDHVQFRGEIIAV